MAALVTHLKKLPFDPDLSHDCRFHLRHSPRFRPVTNAPCSSPVQTLAMVAPPKQQTPGYQEADDDVTPPLVPPPPSCNPQSVSPLAGLGVVVTLAEALVDCLLNGERRQDCYFSPTQQPNGNPVRCSFTLSLTRLLQTVVCVVWLGFYRDRTCWGAQGSVQVIRCFETTHRA